MRLTLVLFVLATAVLTGCSVTPAGQLPERTTPPTVGTLPAPTPTPGTARLREPGDAELGEMPFLPGEHGEYDYQCPGVLECGLDSPIPSRLVSFDPEAMGTATPQ